MKLFDNIKPVYSLDAEVYTTDTTGTDVVDTLGYGDGMLLVVSGDIATTTGDVYTITVKECDTSTGTFATTGLAVSYSNTEDNSVKTARISGLNLTRKRFLRADMTCTGTTLSWEGAAVIILGEPASGPVGN
jgi:hypothetical protein